MIRRYMFIHCTICHGLHANDRGCGHCGAQRFENAQGKVVYVDMGNSRMPQIARPKFDVMRAIRRASRQIGVA